MDSMPLQLALLPEPHCHTSAVRGPGGTVSKSCYVPVLPNIRAHQCSWSKSSCCLAAVMSSDIG